MEDYSARMFAAGVVAGRMSKSGNLGYVAGHPVPALLVGINSFTLGARSVNPKAHCTVIWTNSWCDPPTEAESAKTLVEQGADVVVAAVDSSLPTLHAAAKAGAFCVCPCIFLATRARTLVNWTEVELGPLCT